MQWQAGKKNQIKSNFKKTGDGVSRQKAVKKTALQKEEQSQIRSGYTELGSDEDVTHIYVLLSLYSHRRSESSGGEKVKDHEGNNCSVRRSGHYWKPRETVSSLQLRKLTPPILVCNKKAKRV